MFAVPRLSLPTTVDDEELTIPVALQDIVCDVVGTLRWFDARVIDSCD
jgi:hypothetical protein